MPEPHPSHRPSIARPAPAPPATPRQRASAAGSTTGGPATDAAPAYAELHCLSNFTFLRGASHPEELVAQAIAQGYDALALTDECSFAGSARAHLALRDAIEADPAARTLWLIHGTEIQLADGPKLVLLAQSRQGFGNLSQLITLARRAAPKGSYRLTRADLTSNTAWLDDCLALLVPPADLLAPRGRASLAKTAATPTPMPALRVSARSASGTSGANGNGPAQAAALDAQAIADSGIAGPAGPTHAPPRAAHLHAAPLHGAAALQADAQWLAALMPGRTWLTCTLSRGANDAALLTTVQQVAAASGLPVAATGDVHMHVRARKRLQDTLTAIRLRTPLADAGRRLLPNAERHLRARARLAQLYPPAWLAQTIAIAQRCRFSLAELRYEYPEEVVPAGHSPASWLRQATYDGAAGRFPHGIPDKVRALLEHELALIGELHYEPYFLTVYDIVAFARSRGILCQGRGSAANSAVCFCLGITEVDPARMSVLFERFISKERNEPPDIDVDFEHERREEVMQYLYAKYGRHRAALTAALHTYRPRGALRDVGKALGLSLDQVDRLAKTIGWWEGHHIAPERLREAGFDPDNPLIAQVLTLTHELLGFPRHLSQHSGGFVLARDRLDRMVPIENAAMADRTVIQWDKDDLDALGLLKIDILALGMLTCVRKSLDHIQAFYPAPRERVSARVSARAAAAPAAPPATALTLADIPAECPQVYDMLCTGDSLGVFQVESRAQMNMLPRLRPRCFYDLVIETAIVRPGPIQGGMVHPYLKRRQGLEPVTYPSEAVKGVLARTLGVSIFQEQVMQLAVVAAGFTPGEADKLRRAMAAWRRKGGLGPFRERLIDGMRARGYDDSYAEQIYRQIEGFGEYGFPESHAASFALLVYASSWLKCHEPAAFCAALLDSQPLGFYAPAQIVRDAQAHGVEVLPIDVTVSDWPCRLDASSADPARPAVRLGLALISGLNQAAGQRIVAARQQCPFDDAQDLALRAQLDRGELNRLAAADALATLSGHRRQALWTTLGIETDAPRATPLTAAAPPREAQLSLLPPTEGQDIVADYRHTALSLRRHPLALLRQQLTVMRLDSAAVVAQGRSRQVIRTSGLVTCRQRPSTASGVTFVTLEDETGVINVVVWQRVAERYRRELLGATLLTVYGRIEREGPILHVIAIRLVDHSAMLGGLLVPSRDFH